jgi:uracil-DNA glycosylase family 4
MCNINIQGKQESLEVLNYQIRSCERCSLSATRNHALPGEGNIGARILMVALSPGAKENDANRMFVGPSGQVLDKLFHASGIRREMIYMTNLIKCMLPGNRKPKLNEIELCGEYLDDEISIIQPEVIVPLGHDAARAVLNKFSSNSNGPYNSNSRLLFGKLLLMNNQKIYPLSHPASLLYNPSYEADTIEKYKKLKTFL